MKRTLLAAALALSTFAHATTLKELLAAADSYNLDQRISVEQRRRSAAELTQAWTGLLPGISAQGSWTHNQFETVIQFGPTPITITPFDQFDAILRAEVPLLDVSRWFRISASGTLDEANKEREALVRDNVHRQVATTYYGLAAALALRESAKRSLGVAVAQQKLQEIREGAGAATELEVLRARAEVQRNRQTVADTESLVSNTRRALRTLTGVEVGDDATLPKDDVQSEGALATLEERSQAVPAVRAAEKDAQAAGKLATASKMTLIPLLTGNFTERLTNATGLQGRSNSWGAGVGLVWRLDTATFYGFQAADSSAAVARLASERQKLASRDQVHADYERLTAAIEKVSAAQAQVEAAQRAAQVARDRYAVGAATQIDVIQSERDLFTAEVNQIQARTELVSSRVSLRISAGLPLQLE